MKERFQSGMRGMGVGRVGCGRIGNLTGWEALEVATPLLSLKLNFQLSLDSAGPLVGLVDCFSLRGSQSSLLGSYALSPILLSCAESDFDQI